MKTKIIIASAFIASAVSFAIDNRQSVTNAASEASPLQCLFKDVESCEPLSAEYRQIKIGSPVEKLRTLKDTPIPKGMFWPEFKQKDGAVISHMIARPPDEWGTNYIARTDGHSQKQFYFFHDSSKIIRIIYTELNLTNKRQRPSLMREMHEPVGPLIIEKK